MVATKTELTGVLADLASGEAPVNLYRATREPCVPRRDGKAAHWYAAVRWAMEGLKGPDGEVVKLEVAKAGGTRITTRSALLRFFARLSGPQTPAPPTRRSPARRQRDLDRARQTLQAAGF